MALNPFFLQGTPSEQGLIQDLINEQLKMYGVEVHYIPRKYLNKDSILREVVLSKFTDSYPIEAYVDNYEGYGGQGTILSKFGIQEKDDLTLIISRERFETYISPLMENLDNVELSTRPKEGDLIYFPLGDRLFEIKYVEHEEPFYQLKKTYVYKLSCELFRYEDEVLDTGVSEIDDNVDDDGYIQTLTMVGIASTATAETCFCTVGSGVEKIYISDMGNGYTSQPIIEFSSAPVGGITATGVASITDRYINASGEYGGKIESINIINPGCGYTVAPWITINGGGGIGAAATVGISTGTVGIVTVTSGGSGYTTNPSVSFSGITTSSASNAKGVGYVNTAGIVTSVYVTYGGVGYTTNPTVIIGAPTALGVGIGTGSYIFNEVVTGQTSGTTARVKQWSGVTNVLELGIVSGKFSRGESLVGGTSGAKFMVNHINTDDIVSPFTENDEFETEADKILDFTESNPFGMP